MARHSGPAKRGHERAARQPTAALRSARAPLDWGNPAHGDITPGHAPGSGQARGTRRGALLFNPGGPGVDGLNLTFRLWMRSLAAAPPTRKARQLRLLDEYDMVGFSPRGVGASTQLQCGTNEPSRLPTTA